MLIFLENTPPVPSPEAAPAQVQHHQLAVSQDHHREKRDLHLLEEGDHHPLGEDLQNPDEDHHLPGEGLHQEDDLHLEEGHLPGDRLHLDEGIVYDGILWHLF